MITTVTRLLSLPRDFKKLILVAIDLAALPVLFWAALMIRFDLRMPDAYLSESVLRVSLGMGVFAVAVAWVTGLYRAVVRVFDEQFLDGLLFSVGIMVAVAMGYSLLVSPSMPRSVPFLFGFFMLLWIWGSRAAIRQSVRMVMRWNDPMKVVAIFGAGHSGQQLLAAIRSSAHYYPVVFFDDAPSLVGSNINGLRVYAGKDFGKIFNRLKFSEVFLAVPSASRQERRAILEKIEPYNVRVLTIPSFSQMLQGKLNLADVVDVEVSDLLGRDQVPAKQDLLEKHVRHKVVMVTGAGGSIGSELCHQIIKMQPDCLLLAELCEYSLYKIEQELQQLSLSVPIIPILGSVLNQEKMTRILQHYQVETVYHAAAYKHVPLVELNPFEGIRNNVQGTWHMALAAQAAKVKTFVCISSDKAVRPTNVMGASKRLAELVLQALASQPNQETTFCMVRFGNVLGSSGSVVPLFREQIKRGGPVTVTHPDVTRYFMTIPEAVQLVIQAGSMSEGGDVFVLDMGESVRIVDLAKKMIHLSGHSVKDTTNPSGDIEINFSGLRPGEKLYEELLVGHNVTGTSHPSIMRAREAKLSYAEIGSLWENIERCAKYHNVHELKALLERYVEGYKPDLHAKQILPEIYEQLKSGYQQVVMMAPSD